MAMKKVGIITFHRAENYGSALQAYALKTVINSFTGYKCECVDFQPPHQNDLYDIFLKPSGPKNIIKNLRAACFYSVLKRRKEGFRLFQKKYLDVGEIPLTEQDNMRECLKEYNTLVFGSDQIWNPVSVDFSMEYLGDSFDGNKISYAPSTKNAVEKDFKDLEKVKSLLEQFSSLSVREESGKKLIQHIVPDKDVTIVSDPTLLLEKKQFDNICSERFIARDYIFFYSINYGKEAINMAKYISQKTKMPVYMMFSTNKTYGAVVKGIKLFKKNTSPEDFLSAVKNAHLVLSNSFHGTAFSVIYRKPFYSLRVHKNDGSLYEDARIVTLLNKIGLDDRYITFDKIRNSDLTKYDKIEYNEEKIIQYRQYSLDYLKNALDGGSRQSNG